MRIGETAARAGVSIQAVRLYERLGLLKRARRLPSGYRDYSMDAVRHIRFIKMAQGHGFTLDEIKLMAQLPRREHASVEQVQDLVRNKIGSIEDKIKRLEQQRATLELGLTKCKCRPEYPLCLIPDSSE